MHLKQLNNTCSYYELDVIKLYTNVYLMVLVQNRYNKKMQHSCGVTYSIALSYQFQNNFGKPISITLHYNYIKYNFIRVH